MGKLFQVSVEKKYLKELDEKFVDETYNKFLAYFGNKEQQERIKNLKEEQYQEGFLRDLFVEILGYTLNPKEGWNITTELKNISGSKKADGAIMKNGEAIAVIELKSTSTTDLDKVEEQAFGYKNHHPNCKYIITSNFEKLRFYIQNAVDYEEFDLFSLAKEEFALLWLCLAKDNIFKDLPLNVKDASLFQEEKVTVQLYKDYSMFREQLFLDILENNPDKDKLLLFKKTQKLLDRFLFIFFAEDRFLLPPNSISKIIDQWEQQAGWGDDVTLYHRFKKYFNLLNKGWKGNEYEIYPYNGGLFLPDELLDSIKIGDEVLKSHTLKLSAYNFNPDTNVKADEEKVVDVNILGHIFEHSIGEIENVQAEIKGEKLEKQKSKRKKHGIYYTPKYITKYIVENTVGKLCQEKQEELGIVDEDYAKGRKNRKKTTIKALDEKLDTYREWLLSLTICDPACGSGAFLNQALDFLIEEHRKIDELRAQLFGEGAVFSDITSDILEKNLYGVDLNEESVEIAKLSLWLRTAKKGRKLNTLSNNIKCGNSLIDDPGVAGDKAFKWEEEFPEVFVKGGFDIMIGNPPYVSIKEINDKLKKHFKNSFNTALGQFDLYGLFIEKSYSLLKEKGLFSFITSNTFINNKDFVKLRKLLLTKCEIINIVNLGETVFKDANLDVAILTYKKVIPEASHEIQIIKNRTAFDKNNFSFIKQNRFNIEINNFEFKINATSNDFKLLDKIYENSILLEDFLDLPRGIEIGGNSELIDNTRKFPLLVGKDISRYCISFSERFIDFNFEDKSTFKDIKIYQQPKILIQRIRNLTLKRRIVATFDNDNYFCTNTLRIGLLKNEEFSIKYILAILNSKLINYLFLKFFLNKDIYAYQLSKIPIRNTSHEKQNPLIEKANKILDITSYYENNKNQVCQFIQSKFEITKLTSKLQNWHELEFKEFLKELKKAKVKLSLAEEAECMQYFNKQKQKAQSLKAEIHKTDKEIDHMVYELYGLTGEEIQIVEESVK